MDAVSDELKAAIRGAAFRRLLRTGAPVPVPDLAADLRLPVGEVGAAVRSLRDRGSIHLDGEERVTGTCGLSIAPDRHRIELADRTFWTWCAYDFMGIFGALGATGTAHTRDPLSGAEVEVSFEAGRPRPSSLVLFRPDERLRVSCANVYEQWCPHSNLFESAEAARAWARERSLDGQVLPLAEAGELATEGWRPLADGV